MSGDIAGSVLRRRRGAAAAANSPTMVAHRNCYGNWAALTSSLRFLARARGVGTTSSPAERAADAAPSDTRAANQILDIEAGGGVLDIEAGTVDFLFRLFYFVCSISFVLFRLFYFCWSLPTDGADCRRSYGVSPTTPPIETAPTIGHWGVLSLWHFRLARSGSFLVGGRRAARPIKQSDRPTRTCGGRRRRRISFSPNGSGDESELGWSWRPR